MLQFSFLLAGLTFVGFALIWMKLPTWVRKQITRFPLWFDFVITAFIYMFLGQTLTALLASALFGILVSVYLYIAKIIYHEQPKQAEVK